jgi:hypothetical protein
MGSPLFQFAPKRIFKCAIASNPGVTVFHLFPLNLPHSCDNLFILQSITNCSVEQAHLPRKHSDSGFWFTVHTADRTAHSRAFGVL